MKKAILRTLVYHDLFDYPLTFGELYRFLIAEKKVKERDIQKTLRLMEADRKRIEADKRFYFLRGRGRIVGLRKRRERYSQEKMKIAKQVVKWLGWIPTIKMIGVTGAVAVGNAKKSDDIDFLIITSSGRLWLTRILAVLFIEVLSKRRRPKDKKVADKICLNIFLDENYLQMPKGKQNLFVAHEIVQMKILFEKDEVYQKFLRENKWAKKHLVNSLDTRILGYWDTKRRKKKSPHILISWYLSILAFFEKLAYRFQRQYMASKKTSEQVSLHFAFFHPRDVGEKVMGKYKKRMRAIDLY